MKPRTFAGLQALGRVGFGAAMLIAPDRVGGAWIGRPGTRREAQVLTMAVGARDLAMGLGVARALSQGTGARPWLQAGLLADTADCAATLRSREHLSPVVVAVIAALAGGSVALTAWLLRELD